jgi:hypothetical protein
VGPDERPCGFPARAIGGRSDGARPGRVDDPSMTPPSYAVVWSCEEGVVQAGRIEVADDRVTLVGSSGPERRSLRSVRFDDLVGVRRDRLGGQPALLLERRRGGPIRVASMSGRTILPELQDRLAVRVGR